VGAADRHRVSFHTKTVAYRAIARRDLIVSRNLSGFRVLLTRPVILVAGVLRGGANSGEFNMKELVKMLSFAAILGIVFAIPQTFATSRSAGSLQVLDSDHDGTADLSETKAAASALFDILDRDHDGTLDGRELKGRLSAKELAAEDGDHDGTLTKDEYLATVEKRFKAANRDSDDTLDAKELGSRSGQALQRLVR
jgi:hypothetical protein